MPITPTYQWQESAMWVNIDVKIPNVTTNSADIITTDCYVKVNSSPYFFEADLYGEIDKDESKACVSHGVITFLLVKKEQGLWERLTMMGDRKLRLHRREQSLEAVRKEREKIRNDYPAKFSNIGRLAVGEHLKMEESKRKIIEERKEAEHMKEQQTINAWKKQLIKQSPYAHNNENMKHESNFQLPKAEKTRSSNASISNQAQLDKIKHKDMEDCMKPSTQTSEIMKESRTSQNIDAHILERGHGESSFGKLEERKEDGKQCDSTFWEASSRLSNVNKTENEEILHNESCEDAAFIYSHDDHSLGNNDTQKKTHVSIAPPSLHSQRCQENESINKGLQGSNELKAISTNGKALKSSSVNLPAPRQCPSICVTFSPKPDLPQHLPARESRAREIRLQKSKKISEDALDVSERAPLFLQDKGDKFFRVGDYQSAINAYTDALEKDSSLVVSFANRATCKLLLKDYRCCVEDCTNALQILAGKKLESIGDINSPAQDSSIPDPYDSKELTSADDSLSSNVRSASGSHDLVNNQEKNPIDEHSKESKTTIYNTTVGKAIDHDSQWTNEEEKLNRDETPNLMFDDQLESLGLLTCLSGEGCCSMQGLKIEGAGVEEWKIKMRKHTLIRRAIAIYYLGDLLKALDDFSKVDKLEPGNEEVQKAVGKIRTKINQ